MKKFHIVKIHWDRRKPEITSEWIKARAEFYAQNTMKSLMGQTRKPDLIWHSCGENMTVADQDAVTTVEGAGISCVVTLGPNHNPQDGLTGWIPEDVDYVYVTRIDSDDLYAPDALELAYNCNPKVLGYVEASMFRQGYIYDTNKKILSVYNSPSTPFHTMMIPREVFVDPAKYAALDYGDHSKVNSNYPTQVLPGWRFCVLVHGNNFLSTIEYSSKKCVSVERGWSIERFLSQPVVFDLDDFCDEHNCLSYLRILKAQYPNFKCTLFTIPSKISQPLLDLAASVGWIELAVHGRNHEPNEELKSLDGPTLGNYLSAHVDYSKYCKGFRPPGWYITREHIQALNKQGHWVALHVRDEKELGPLCDHGYYVCNEKPYWHGHTHNVCNNGIRETLPMLLKKWPKDQHFSFVSEAVLIPQAVYNAAQH